jgi:hypothetical protein
VLTEIATLGASLVEDARDMADEMLKGDPEAIPLELVEALPLVFELEKAFPPRRRDDDDDDRRSGGPPSRPASESGRNAGRDDRPEDPDDDPDDGQGDTNAPVGGGDDVPTNPIETITKLASIIVVIAGSLQHAMGGDAGVPGQDPAAGQAADARNVGLQRGEPLLDQPLAKILAGEAELQAPGMGQMTLAGAVEELAKLKAAMPVLQKQMGEKDEAFRLLKARFEQIAAEPVPSRGAAKPVPVSKGEDMGGGPTIEVDVATLEKLAKQYDDGGAASKFMIGRVHQAGGSPLVPPS